MKASYFIRKEKGIVLRTINFKESSLIFNLFGEYSGNVKIIAFGVRRITNPFRGIISAGNIVEVVYHKKETSEFGKMREVKLLWSPENIFKDTKKFLVMGFFLKILLKYLKENARFPELFNFSINTLKELNEIESLSKSFFYSLILKFLKATGIGPELNVCLKCKNKLKEGFFVIKEGGIFCEQCSTGFEEKIRIPKRELSYLRFLLKENLKSAKNLKIEKEDILNKSIFRFIDYYLGENFEKEINIILKNL